MAASVRIQIDSGIVVEAPDSDEGKWFYVSITRLMPFPLDDIKIFLDANEVHQLRHALNVVQVTREREEDA